MIIWDNFWKNKGENIEWGKNEVLNSKSLNNLLNFILDYYKKENLKGLDLIELGSGMGLTSYFFAKKGGNVTLLDNSKKVKNLIKSYFENVKYTFILNDLFDYSLNKKYDLVTSFGLCEHFIKKRRKEVLQKHIDLLKKKGIAIISVPYKFGIFYRIGKFFAELTGFWDFGLEIPFSKKELIGFAQHNNLRYKIIMGGFWSSAYDLFVRKPLKVLKIHSKRRFDGTKSIFDKYFGSAIIIVLFKQ